jgi:hypothetical protein
MIYANTYMKGTGEYNLYSLHRSILIKAFDKHYHKKNGIERVAVAMGVSVRTVYTMTKVMGLRPLLKKRRNTAM